MIEDGFKAVHKALFGVDSSIKVSSCGTCSRCKVPLVVSAADGNAQANHRFQFRAVGEKRLWPGILNGLWAKLEWEADLCDGCLNSLSDWLLGERWRFEEAKHCRHCQGNPPLVKEKPLPDGGWLMSCPQCHAGSNVWELSE